MKKALIYFSPTGATKLISDYYQMNLSDYEVIEITNNQEFKDEYFILILSFPIYGQGIPKVVKKAIRSLKGKYAVINVTYGGVSWGRGLKKAANILHQNGFKIIGGAIIQTKHTYSNNPYFHNYQNLNPIINKLRNEEYTEIKIPRQAQNILSYLFPSLRMRLSIKIIHNQDKCQKCYKCINHCPVQALTTNFKCKRNCIRCLRCVKECPHQALSFKHNVFLKLYLKMFLKKHKSLFYY